MQEILSVISRNTIFIRLKLKNKDQALEYKTPSVHPTRYMPVTKVLIFNKTYQLSQYQLSGLAMSEEEGAIDNDFMFLYDNVDGYRFFLGEVPWVDFIVSVKKIYILPGEKQDDNEEYLEEGDADNSDGNAGAAADGDDDAAGEDGALDAVVAEDEGDGADDDVDGVVGEDGDGAYDDEDEVVGDDGDDAGAEDNDGGAAE
uniref:Putative auxin-responsive protein IAA29 n=1 Tax=Aegilops tauschii TaxID=37682 RepID=M8BYC7_AEGTA